MIMMSSFVLHKLSLLDPEATTLTIQNENNDKFLIKEIDNTLSDSVPKDANLLLPILEESEDEDFEVKFQSKNDIHLFSL